MDTKNAVGKPNKPVTPKGHRTRKAILEAARKVFASSGYVAMKMGDVANTAGLSLGALYRYFENKDDLFLSVISDIHEELFSQSRLSDKRLFKDSPYEALYESNYGYLNYYYINREVMRSFIEATMVDDRYRDMWWYMRERHINRVVAALKRDHKITEVGGNDARVLVESLASMTEQSAFVWFSQESLCTEVVGVETATSVVTEVWYKSLFSNCS